MKLFVNDMFRGAYGAFWDWVGIKPLRNRWANEFGCFDGLSKFYFAPVGKQNVMTSRDKGKKAKIIEARNLNLHLVPNFLEPSREAFSKLVYDDDQLESILADNSDYINVFLRARPTNDAKDFNSFKWFVVFYKVKGIMYPVGYFKVLQDYERQWTYDYAYMPKGSVSAYLSEVYVDRDMANLFKVNGLPGLGRLVLYFANMALCGPKTGSCQLLVVKTKNSAYLQKIYEELGYKVGQTIKVKNGPSEVRMHCRPYTMITQLERVIDFNGKYEYPPEELVKALEACKSYTTTDNETFALQMKHVGRLPEGPQFKKFLCKVKNGSKVEKAFGGQLYKGEIWEYDADMDWYRVVYEDGDEEDMDIDDAMAVARF